MFKTFPHKRSPQLVVKLFFIFNVSSEQKKMEGWNKKQENDETRGKKEKERKNPPDNFFPEN